MPFSGEIGYTLDDVVIGIGRTNELLAGVILFLGIIFGCLLLKILWDRF